MTSDVFDDEELICETKINYTESKDDMKSNKNRKVDYIFTIFHIMHIRQPY